jgi:hypothetical protein
VILNLLLAFAASAAVHGPDGHDRLKPPLFFADGSRNPSLLWAIRHWSRKKIDFDGHYSLTFVPCGTGCGSFWFVDRATGATVEAPTSPIESEDTYDIRVKPDSDVLTVVYGPRDGLHARCFARRFRWTGQRFLALDRRAPAQCPDNVRAGG